MRNEIQSVIKMKTTMGSINKFDKGKKWREGSKDKWLSDMISFLSFCQLQGNPDDKKLSGLGIDRNLLSFGLILFPEIIIEYIDFRTARSDGITTKSIHTFLSSLKTMLSFESGWVYGHPELLEKLPKEYIEVVENNGGWERSCGKQHKFILETLKNLEFRNSRDVFESIMPILEAKEPLLYIKKALESNLSELRYKCGLPSHLPLYKSLSWRDYILMCLVSRLPLRSKHWREMRFKASNNTMNSDLEGTNLIKTKKGDWGICISAKSFKNHRNKEIFGVDCKEDIRFLFRDIPGLQEIEKDLDEYMEVYRPELCSGDGPVFPDRFGKGLVQTQLYTIMSCWSRKYLSEKSKSPYGLRIKGVRPFGAHSYRHIAATHIVVTTGRFDLTANLLLDKEETVRKHYGRFVPQQRLRSALAQMDIWSQNSLTE